MHNPGFVYDLLEWDTTFFGFGVARIHASSLSQSELQHVLHILKEQKIRLVYWFLDPTNVSANESARKSEGLLVDKKVTYVQTLSKDLPYSQDTAIHSYLHHPINKRLISLSQQSGEYSRFRLDPHFERTQFEKLYAIWIEKSLSGERADEVLVYKDHEEELGILTLGKKGDRGDIGILAVDQHSRGKSIGTKLMLAAFKKVLQWNVGELQVVTQKDNKIACSFYEKQGFKEEKVEHIYHFWL